MKKNNTTNAWAWRLISRLAFNRVSVIHRQRIPASGPLLFVATHRNGALDAAAYKVAIDNAMPMVSAQLQGNAVGRFLFQGIAVARAKDRKRGLQGDNVQAVNQCIELLQDQGRLFVMPEGTSSLGPCHLPFQRGAAKIAHAALQAGVKLRIVPLAVHYLDPTAWQSRVEILVGDAVQPASDSTVATLHRMISQALEAVGANFENQTLQRNAETLAYASTLGSDRSYAESLKYFEKIDPDHSVKLEQRMRSLLSDNKLFNHQGVALIPARLAPFYFLYWLLLMPFPLAFSLLNAPVLIAGYIASRTLPDDNNVIAFWRMVVALPLGLLWAVLLSVLAAATSGGVGLVLYWLTSVIGIKTWYRFRKLSAALANGVLRANVQSGLAQLQRDLVRDMP